MLLLSQSEIYCNKPDVRVLLTQYADVNPGFASARTPLQFETTGSTFEKR